MKEATGEGSMTIVTIVIIVALAAAAAIIVGVMMSKANTAANTADDDVDITLCPSGQHQNETGECVADTTPTP